MKFYVIFLFFIFPLFLESKIHTLNWVLSKDFLNPDGVYKSVYTINGIFPPPSIEINKGDTINLTLINHSYMESTSIHWHGLNINPYMDGVSYVTQYPIFPLQTFNYNFEVNQKGTYWYHSHENVQYADGLRGAFIVHDLEDPYDIRNKNPLIQEEIILTLGDWYHQNSITHVEILKQMGYPWSFPPYNNVLWNGKGFFNCSEYNNHNLIFESSGDKYNCKTPKHPRFNIAPGLPLRFRLINAGSGLTLIYSIDYHDLIVIAVDGVEVEHFNCNRLLIYVGQRYDVLVYPKNITILDFWIRTNTLDYPTGEKEESLAILSYFNSTLIPNTLAWDIKSKNLSNISQNIIPANNVPKFKISEVLDNLIQINLNLSCSYSEYLCSINNIPYKADLIPIILQKYENEKITNPSVITIPYGKYVKLIINNPLGKSHPIHLHFGNFWILGVGKVGDGNYYKQKLNTHNPLYRDTLQINQYSWSVLLFHNIYDTPMFFHCHIEWHLSSGMAVIFMNEKIAQEPPSTYPILTVYNNTKFLNLITQKIQDDISTAIYLGFIFLLFGGILIYCVFKSKKYTLRYNRVLN